MALFPRLVFVIINFAIGLSIDSVLQNYTHGSSLHFGIKVSTEDTILINPDIYLTLFLPPYAYQCRFTPMITTDASSQPWIWNWCDINSTQATIWSDSNDSWYGIMINNDNNMNISVTVDVIAIQAYSADPDHETGTIWIDEFNNDMDTTIGIESNTSILINLQDSDKHDIIRSHKHFQPHSSLSISIFVEM